MDTSAKVIDEHTGRYLPVIYPEELPFWEGTRRRELILQRCNGCGKSWFPIGPACPHCFSMSWKWDKMSGRGTLHNFVVFHKAWTKWFQPRVPYAVVQIQLEEGPRLTTNFLECELKDIRIGMPVEAVYEDITSDITLIQFRPRKA